MTNSKQRIPILLLLLICSYSIDTEAKHNATAPCLPDQASSLLQLKRSFIDIDGNLASWRTGRDCCHWEGVTCDMASGRVVSLDLGWSNFSMWSDYLEPALFNLTSLRNLSLASIDFNEADFPSYGFERLTDIIHLNFSRTYFNGQIPIGIAHLKNLVTLDFSYNYELYLQEPNFRTFMSNLSSLRELHLDEVDISSGGSTWPVVLADHVPELQTLSLFESGITGPIHPSFSRLRSLTAINLGGNNLIGEVPEFFADFYSLSTLDLSSNSFDGKFPTKIFRLKSLRTLDLSGNPNLSVCLPDFPVGNNLETLNLEGSTLSCDIPPSLTNLESLKTLGISTTGISKGGSIISKLPALNTLELSGWGMEKPILSWIGNLNQLVSLELSGYDFSQSVPSWIGNLTSLTSLEIQGCTFHGPIPYEIGNLTSLTILGIEVCTFHGPIPYQIGGLANLGRLYFSNCNYTGPIPSWIGNLTKLTELALFRCNFSGQIPSTIGNLTQLELFHGEDNNLSGKIPKFLLVLPALQELFLSSNQLSSLEETPTLFSSPLTVVSLDNNYITGPIPKSFFQLKNLEALSLHSNRFSGTIKLSSFWRLKNLSTLDMSDNMLKIMEEESGNTLSSFPTIRELGLASCNLKRLPGALKYLDHIKYLDLSNNQISGVIPSWIWKNQLVSLSLSSNMFTTLEKSPSLVDMPILNYLNLGSNELQGTIPIPLTTTNELALDYSNNSFSSIEPNFGRYIRNTIYLDVSWNKLNGHVPSSICNAGQLGIMDLSYNNFSGSIPSCLIESGNMRVLKLRKNQFHGTLPENIKEGCKFETVDLSENQIEGELPRSLSSCQDLALLDVGNNQIIGSFPFWMGVLPELRVLVLRSNKLNGTIRDIKDDHSIKTHFQSLQILDLSSNNFSGNLPKAWFNELKAMMTTDNDQGQVLGHNISMVGREFYQDTITITFKGFDLMFNKILTAFKVIDLSNNSFDGPVPETIGGLVSLHGFDISHNNFTGQIPYQFSNMSQLESLDLSWNQLSGEIPQELTSLTSLEWLNLSYNSLTGSIPHQNQFSTFPNSSFEGNAGLCGIPLSKQCGNQDPIAPTAAALPDTHSLWEDKLSAILLFAFVGLGFGVGFALSFLLRQFCRIEGWVCKH